MSRATVIDGKARAAELTERITKEAAGLQQSRGIRPGLAVVIVGEDPASQVYVRNKKRKAESCGFYSVQHSLPEDVAEVTLLELIESLNRDDAIHGILVQLPLPGHIDERKVTQAVDPGKDVDGFHFRNIGMLTAGFPRDAFVPCTPAGCMLLIEDHCDADLSGLQATVVGRSNIVGKPMGSLLLQANATVTTCHSRTRNLAEVCRGADILVAAAGQPELVRGSWIKPGAVVIDVGINRQGEGPGKLVGDVCFEEALDVARALTPVPGGVGPMTIVMLMANTLKAARQQR